MRVVLGGMFLASSFDGKDLAVYKYFSKYSLMRFSAFPSCSALIIFSYFLLFSSFFFLLKGWSQLP